MRPETRYAKSGDLHIAYQVIGDGPRDLVLSPGFISNLDLHWEEPGYSRLLRTLGGFARVIHFDKRGTGLSDRVGGIPTLEQRMDDVRAVMDAAGSRSAAIFGASEGGAMAMLFAATYPRRTEALVLYGSYAHFHAWVLTREQLSGFVANAEKTWGSGSSLKSFAPNLVNHPTFADWWARYERQGASPAAAIALAQMNGEIDVRHILPLIRVPTLVLHRTGDPRVRVEAGRYLAQHIPGAVYKELPGNSHPIWTGETQDITDAVVEFLTGQRADVEHDSVLATVLALELTAASAGAHAHGDVSDRYRQGYELITSAIERFHGRRLSSGLNTALAAFDGPARAVRCAKAIRTALEELGLLVRAGLHAGELSTAPRELSGLAVLAASRIAAEAAPMQLLASSTVRDLVAGSGLMFREHGTCSLGSSLGTTKVYAVVEAGTAPPGAPVTRAVTPAAPSPLTARERDIVRHLAHGLTNAEIAAALDLSEHTVKRHVANILTKLDLPSRAAVAAFAAREGLIRGD
ncbi:MAG: alpha/beta fold hydrolase [Hyphomicrobiaceae bacterium]